MSDALEPVTSLAEEEEGGPRPGVGLAVSGGGYRAMLFHLGSFLRLFELGLLTRLDRISSVSGGSITAAKIGLEWPRLTSRDAFMERVVAPIRALAGTSIDVPAVIAGLILPGGVAARVSKAYRKHLYGDATLQDLPDDVRFVINATNLETGKLWRFSKPYMRDWRMGKVANPRVSLADAVTASSAFPPILSPFILKSDPQSFTDLGPGITPDMLARILAHRRRRLRQSRARDGLEKAAHRARFGCRRRHGLRSEAEIGLGAAGPSRLRNHLRPGRLAAHPRGDRRL